MTHPYTTALLVGTLGVGTALTTLPSQAQTPSADALKTAEANFKAADTGKTGKLGPAEFKAFIDANAAAKIGRAAQIKSNNAYQRAFNAVDANKDGAVTWDEYVAVLKR
jgi:Ca2+-binding EF-hand superfamily protein